MKKCFTFLSILLMVVQASAQALCNPVLRNENNHASAPKPFLLPRAEEDTQWWGFYDGTDQRYRFGLETAQTYNFAIHIDASNGYVTGKEVEAMRIYLCGVTSMTNVKIWFSEELPDDPDQANYVQNVDVSTLIGGDESENQPGLPNDITLTTPYTIPESGVYAGITFTITAADEMGSKYPTVIADPDMENGLFYKDEVFLPRWTDMNGTQCGHYTMQLKLKGDFTNNAARPEDFGNIVTGVGLDANIPLVVTNMGKDDITQLSYVLTRNGADGEEQHVSLDQPIANGLSGKLNIPLGQKQETGVEPLKLTITQVNGQENSAGDKVAEGSLEVMADIYQRNALIEEFTTESCLNCPRVAGYLHEALESSDENRVFAVCHHSAYYTDWLTMPCDETLTWLFNDKYTYAPAVMTNRQPIFTSSDYTGEADNVVIPMSAEAMKAMIDYQLAQLSNLYLTIEAIPSNSATEITVTVNGHCNNLFDKSTSLLTVYATEDSIKALNQRGTTGDYYHQHVIRYYNNDWGDEITWNGNDFTATYSFAIDPTWNTDRMKFIAFVNKHNEEDKLDCAIENSMGCVLGKASSVEGVFNTQHDAHEVARYTLSGQRINTPQYGVNIIKMSDGTVRKVVIKDCF